jgi:hypothetical protein
MTIWSWVRKPENWALFWRVCIIALIPIGTFVVPTVYWNMHYTLYPQSAAGMRFGIRLDKTTAETCLIFKSDTVPEDLRDYLCPE